jgi:hypothetical protein
VEALWKVEETVKVGGGSGKGGGGCGECRGALGKVVEALGKGDGGSGVVNIEEAQ